MAYRNQWVGIHNTIWRWQQRQPTISTQITSSLLCTIRMSPVNRNSMGQCSSGNSSTNLMRCILLSFPQHSLLRRYIRVLEGTAHVITLEERPRYGKHNVRCVWHWVYLLWVWHWDHVGWAVCHGGGGGRITKQEEWGKECNWKFYWPLFLWFGNGCQSDFHSIDILASIA